MTTPDDIRAQHLEIRAKTGLSQKALNKLLGISQTHLDRVFADPVQYAKRIAELKIRGDEILKEYEAQKLLMKSRPNAYGDNTPDEDEYENGVTQRLSRMELTLEGLEMKWQEERKQNRVEKNRSTERENALIIFLMSKQTEDDKKILSTRLEEIERNYQAAMTIKEFPALPDNPAQ